MKTTIEHAPSYGVVHVELAEGEVIRAEAGAMVAKSAHVEVQTRSGGLFKAIRRKFGGESFFQNEFTAVGRPGKIMLAPRSPGDLRHIQISGKGPTLTASSYLASHPDVTTETRFAGLRGLLGGEGLTLLETEGHGDLFFNAFGAIREIQVERELVVDTGHLVGFSGDLQWKTRRVGGWKSTIFSGEGLVMNFEGRGTVWVQTRSDGGFVTWLAGLLPR